MWPDFLFVTWQELTQISGITFTRTLTHSRSPPFVSVCAEIEFKEGDKEHMVEVDVLYDGVREMREAFTLHLKPDENMVAETQVADLPAHNLSFCLSLSGRDQRTLSGHRSPDSGAT